MVRFGQHCNGSWGGGGGGSFPHVAFFVVVVWFDAFSTYSSMDGTIDKFCLRAFLLFPVRLFVCVSVCVCVCVSFLRLLRLSNGPCVPGGVELKAAAAPFLAF